MPHSNRQGINVPNKSLVNRLNKRITILRPPSPDETDEAGQPIDDWHPVATVWAAIIPLRGRELESARQIHAEVTTRIEMRYRKGIDPTMKAIHTQDGEDFEFEFLYRIHPEFGKKELHMLAKEHQ